MNFGAHDFHLKVTKIEKACHKKIHQNVASRRRTSHVDEGYKCKLV
jgi:hypothetical protein